MRNLWRRAVSAVLIVLTVALTVSSSIVSTSANDVLLSRDTETAALDQYSKVMVGIDVSSYQGNIDWAKVKAAGVEFAMLRMYSHVPDTPNYTVDSKFIQNLQGARAQGIHVGGYFFSYARNLDDVRNEATMVVNMLKDYPAMLDFPIVFDAEKGDTKDGFDITNFAADACVTFRQILESAGYYVMIYANSNWFNNVITPASKIAGCDLWQAHYPGSYQKDGSGNYVLDSSGNKIFISTYKGQSVTVGKDIVSLRPALNNNNAHVYMWQYTEQGSVNGISGQVDMNVATRDFSQRIKDLGRNGFPKPVTHTHSYQAGNDTTHHYQICACGDKQNVVAHSYTVQYKNATHHEKICSCQYVMESVEHKFEYVVGENSHKLQCSCGYVQPSSDAEHIYNIISSGENQHFNSCVCGAVDNESIGGHSYIFKFDEESHYRLCSDCGYVDPSSMGDHELTVQKSDRDGHWKECECGAKGVKRKHTSTTEKCADCGYHYHLPMFDSKEHWVICETCPLRTRADIHWFDENGDCTECGFKKENTCEHKMTNGTCSECGYHEHQYVTTADTHTMSCLCAQNAVAEEHSFKNKKCTVCGYSIAEETEPTDGTYDEDAEIKPGEEIGCEASVGATAVISAVAAIGCALMLRKKEDN